MSKLRRLLDCYRRQISIPWRKSKADSERVIFCIYPQNLELQLRAFYPEFELASHMAGHPWKTFDLTDTFPVWLSTRPYREKYFADPELLLNNLSRYTEHLQETFASLPEMQNLAGTEVVALTGVGTLFGICRVKEVVDVLAPLVPGRLVVFFPGSREKNNYRLLDAYDGWDYLAVSITPECDD